MILSDTVAPVSLFSLFYPPKNKPLCALCAGVCEKIIKNFIKVNTNAQLYGIIILIELLLLREEIICYVRLRKARIG